MLDKLKDIGIDTEVGLSFTGTEDVYQMIIEAFCEDYEATRDKIEDTLNQQDIKNYTIRVHGLKSSSNTIGAIELGKTALELENAGKENNVAYIEAHTSELLETYEKVVTDLKRVLNN